MYDKKARYDAQIAGKVEEIRVLCNRIGIPCFMAFAPKQDAEGNFLITGASLIPELVDVQSDDRRFHNMILALRGFRLVPPGAENPNLEAIDDTDYYNDYLAEDE